MEKPVPEDFGLTNQEYRSLVEQLWQGPVPEDFCLTNQQYLSILTRHPYNIFDFIWVWIKAFILSVIVGGLIGFVIAGVLQGMGLPIKDSFVNDFVGAFVIASGVGFFIQAYREQKSLIQSRQHQKKLSDHRYQKVALYEEAIREYQCHQESYWKSLRGVQFEKALANLYRNLGYSVQETKGSGDEGIDLILRKNNKETIVQCKGHEKPIGVGAIRDLCGAMTHAGAERAVLACPAGFTDGVRKFADGKPIDLLAAKELVEMAESVSNDKFV
jgi:hypothetical protein